jgi:hypothetical protein
MSLRRIVVEMIVERGCGTVDHLMPKLSKKGYTRGQAIKALQNARSLGFLWCEPAKKAGVPTTSTKPGVYWPGQKEVDPMYAALVPKKPEPRRMLVRSVFDLASPIAAEAIPPRKGRVYQSLGPWGDLHA